MWEAIKGAFGFGGGSGGGVGSFMDNPYNNSLNFDMNGQQPTPQWQQNAINPIQGGDPYLNQGMQQASGNIAVSDSYGGFGNDDNTGYAGSDWGEGMSDVIEAASKFKKDKPTVAQARASVGSFSGGGGTFRPVEAPRTDLSYLNPYTSPFTNGWKR